MGAAGPRGEPTRRRARRVPGEVTVHHRQWPIGFGCRLGGRGQLWCVRSPRRQRGDSSLESTWTSLRVREAARTSRARGAVVHYGPRTSGPGCRLGRAEDVVRQYWLWLPGLADRLEGRGQLRRSRSPRRQLESSSLGSCRTSRRAHEASHTSCAGRGHSTSRAAAHRVQLPTWGTGPAPAHPEPKTLAGRLQLGSLQGLPFFRGTGCRYQMVNTSVQNRPAK